MAAATGFGAAMQELMQWKANLNVKDKDGKTPLHKVGSCETQSLDLLVN